MVAQTPDPVLSSVWMRDDETHWIVTCVLDASVTLVGDRGALIRIPLGHDFYLGDDLVNRRWHARVLAGEFRRV